MPAKEVHELGLREVDRLDEGDAGHRRAIVQDLGRQGAAANGCGPIQQYLFKSRQELIDYSTAALARAKAAAPNWFGLLPKSDVRIEPYPAYRETQRTERVQRAGRGRQPPGALLHQRLSGREEEPAPASSRRRSTRRFRATTCRTPSRIERKEIHPIGRYLGSSGYAEGLGALCRGPGRRDEALLVRRRSARHAVVTGVPRRAAGRRHRHARLRAGSGSRRSTTCSRTPPKRRTMSQPKSTATSSGRGRRPLTCWGCWKSSGCARTREQKLGPRVRHQGVSRSRAGRRRRAARLPHSEDSGLDRRFFLISSQPSSRRLISFSNPRSGGW